jgi:hypothetical protein
MAAASGFLALPLCLHVAKRWVAALLQGQLDAFDQQIMDLAALVEATCRSASYAASGK